MARRPKAVPQMTMAEFDRLFGDEEGCIGAVSRKGNVIARVLKSVSKKAARAFY